MITLNGGPVCPHLKMPHNVGKEDMKVQALGVMVIIPPWPEGGFNII